MNISPRIISKIIKRLKRRYGTISYSNEPFKVLISTILSQRTRDENTARASKKLFSKFKTPEEIVNAKEKEIQSLIKECGFYKVKARRLKEVSKILIEEFNGKVPSKMEELLSLPGVGKKTTNCVLVYGFQKEAIPVDTHVHRISNKIGLVGRKKTKTPEETEVELMKNVPKKFWLDLNSLFVEFGKEICLPRKPKCYDCIIIEFCNYPDKVLRKF
jgi:endonuclease-3